MSLFVLFFVAFSVAQIQSPNLVFQFGGCVAPEYCEIGWYSSPAYYNKTIYSSAYSIVALNVTDGSLIWRVYSGYDRKTTSGSSVGRTWPGIVFDENINGKPGIITAHDTGIVSAYDLNGYFLPGFPQTVVSGSEIRALTVNVLQNGKNYNIILGIARGNIINSFVYDLNGNLLSGWPQRQSTTQGNSWGIYNNNFCTTDLDGDGNIDIIAPSDVHYISAYKYDGTPIQSYIFGVWGNVGAYIDLQYELQGYGPCGTQATYRSNWNSASCSVFKMNNDSKVVIVGNTHNCNTNPYTDVYNSLWIFSSNRSRFIDSSNSINWTTPLNSGAPKSEDYNVIETVETNVAIGDLDGDGIVDFVYPSYDGKVYAYNLKQQLFPGFPFNLMPSQSYIEFGSECVLADIDNNGKSEIIFTTWTQKGSNNFGNLYILSYNGTVIYKVPLPLPKSTINYGGGLAAPTLIKDEITGNLKIICQTIHAGVVLYEIPSSSNSKIFWGTGKGNYRRNGNYQDLNIPPTVNSASTFSFFSILFIFILIN